jgi:rhodanese-related sulfurtransferase
MRLIDRHELREKLERGDEFKLVMTLSELAYRAKHIPTSVYFETMGDALDVLDPGEEIVVYCSDVHCAASIYAYGVLEREGYRSVRRYAGGIADWEDAGYPLEAGTLDAPAARPARRRPVFAGARARAPWRICA